MDNKILIYNSTGDVVFSKSINGTIKEITIKTNKEELTVHSNYENKSKKNKLDSLFSDDEFWDD